MCPKASPWPISKCSPTRLCSKTRLRQRWTAAIEITHLRTRPHPSEIGVGDPRNRRRAGGVRPRRLLTRMIRRGSRRRLRPPRGRPGRRRASRPSRRTRRRRNGPPPRQRVRRRRHPHPRSRQELSPRRHHRRRAPAPHRPAPSADQVYLKLAAQIPGVTVTDPKVAIATGHAMCTGLQYGESPADAAAATASNTNTTPAQARAAVNAAITAYCPQYRR